ncbi:MAG: class II aldolase/adducin family protein [Myxococcales bacterium]|nr:class II aldolase/adducin family protein [Myxococcales bacterium]
MVDKNLTEDGLWRARAEVAEVCRMMHQQGLIVASDGNVSVRVGDSDLLITPAGATKRLVRPEDVVRCTLAGDPYPGQSCKPSSEMGMHLAIYQTQRQVRGIVHAHPPCALAHTIAGMSVVPPLMPEVFCELGEVPTVPYTRPGSVELPKAVANMIRGRVAVMMERHGSVTIGRTLAKAYERLEVLEHGARISLMSQVLNGGPVASLKPDQLAILVSAQL